jgi:hypothetical protein
MADEQAPPPAAAPDRKMPESGCLLFLPVGDGTYRQCRAPTADGVFCQAHKSSNTADGNG